MASTCTLTFAVNVLASTGCHIAMDNTAPVKVTSSKQNEIEFIKYFSYSLGPNPDRMQPTYGFDLETLGRGAFAVTTVFQFQPTAPRYVADTAQVQHGRVFIKATLNRRVAEQVAQDAPVIDVIYRIRMNTGT